MAPGPRGFAVLSLLALAATQVAYAVLASPALAVVAGLDPGSVPPLPALRALAVGGGVAVGALALAVVALAAAIGVATGSRWGWVAGVVAGALWVPSGCFPVALVVLAVLLHPSVRGPIWAPPPPPPPSDEPREEYA